MRYQVSKAAVELIKRFEGYRRKAAQAPDGRWTIGYGHTQTARVGAEISERDAEALLIYDLIGIAHAINEWTFTPLTQNQFDALCAFAFNIGLKNFRHSSVLRRINEGALVEAACAMELWRRADFEGERIVVDALVRRRAVEKSLFLTPPDGFVTAPTPLLPPLIDADRMGGVPSETPVALREKADGQRITVARDETPTPQPAPPEPEDDGGPVAAAAAATVARLKTILPDPETPPQPVASQAPLADEPLAAAEPAADNPPKADSAAPPQPGPPIAARTVPGRPIKPAAKPASKGRGAVSARLFLLGAIGLGLFGGALFLAFRAEPTADGGMLSPLVGSWIIGVLGIACFGVAAYLILERLGGDDDRLGGPNILG